jgi:hypothetical protein
MAAQDLRQGNGGTARLRGDIDSGRTKDKVSFADPAAAPLGTDEEAAGTPPSPEAVALARRNEGGRAGPSHTQRRIGGFGAWLVIAALMAAAILIGARLFPA